MSTSRPLSVALLAALALTSTACGSSDSPTAATPSSTNQVARNAQQYMSAWMANPHPETRCRLETKAKHPNYAKDGGTLTGCINTYASRNATPTAGPTRAPLTITIDHIQDVAASAKHPAGKGALANLHRQGEEPFRYALRLVQDEGQWRVEQTESINGDYRHTADPVLAVLASMG